MRVSETLEVAAGGRLNGTVVIPGDKSISHRAVMLSALADGECSVAGCLMGDDVASTVAAFRAMGVTVDAIDDARLNIHGVGVDGLAAPAGVLDLGNSGTSMRLLCGILAGAGISATLTGDASLSRRPMRRVAAPLASMGARIDTSADGTPPLRIAGSAPLHAIDYALPVASAQVKSAVLLAGLFAAGRTAVHEPATTRDHTERMLSAFGVELERAGSRVSLVGGQRLRATEIVVPADISSAAFFIVGAAIAGGSVLELNAIGMNPTRTGILDILRAMNARITVLREYAHGNEPVADLRLESSPLRGIEIPPHLVPLAIDEFPAIFIAAACAEGTTVLRGAAELRLKESDRIAVMSAGLHSLGIAVETFDDGLAIVGGQFNGGRIDAEGDHRVAMAFAMAALRAAAPVVIDNAAAISTSFPDFVPRARAAGLRIA
jgi:3-phosphoshikimate 1-carboxyvinyltransferase